MISPVQSAEDAVASARHLLTSSISLSLNVGEETISSWQEQVTVEKHGR